MNPNIDILDAYSRSESLHLFEKSGGYAVTSNPKSLAAFRELDSGETLGVALSILRTIETDQKKANASLKLHKWVDRVRQSQEESDKNFKENVREREAFLELTKNLTESSYDHPFFKELYICLDVRNMNSKASTYEKELVLLEAQKAKIEGVIHHLLKKHLTLASPSRLLIRGRDITVIPITTTTSSSEGVEPFYFTFSDTFLRMTALKLEHQIANAIYFDEENLIPSIIRAWEKEHPGVRDEFRKQGLDIEELIKGYSQLSLSKKATSESDSKDKKEEGKEFDHLDFDSELLSPCEKLFYSREEIVIATEESESSRKILLALDNFTFSTNEITFQKQLQEINTMVANLFEIIDEYIDRKQVSKAEELLKRTIQALQKLNLSDSIELFKVRYVEILKV